jgi:hypothetical protein
VYLGIFTVRISVRELYENFADFGCLLWSDVRNSNGNLPLACNIMKGFELLFEKMYDVSISHENQITQLRLPNVFGGRRDAGAIRMGRSMALF